MKTEFTPVVNEMTGKTDFNFSGKLISIGTKKLANVNGKEYVVGTIEFYSAQGEKIQRSAQIHDKSLVQGMETGRNYLCTAQEADNGDVYIRASHLVLAERASASDFGSLFGAPVAEAVAEAGDEA